MSVDPTNRSPQTIFRILYKDHPEDNPYNSYQVNSYIPYSMSPAYFTLGSDGGSGLDYSVYDSFDYLQYEEYNNIIYYPTTFTYTLEDLIKDSVDYLEMGEGLLDVWSGHYIVKEGKYAYSYGEYGPDNIFRNHRTYPETRYLSSKVNTFSTITDDVIGGGKTAAKVAYVVDVIKYGTGQYDDNEEFAADLVTDTVIVFTTTAAQLVTTVIVTAGLTIVGGALDTGVCPGVGTAYGAAVGLSVGLGIENSGYGDVIREYAYNMIVEEERKNGETTDCIITVIPLVVNDSCVNWKMNEDYIAYG